MKNLAQICTEANALELSYNDPAKQQAKDILKALRDKLGLPTANPIWKQYIVFRQATSNKMHYIAIFPDDAGKFIVANASGRIGDKPVAHIIGLADSRYEADKIALAFAKKKMSKGYEPATMEGVEEDVLEAGSNWIKKATKHKGALTKAFPKAAKNGFTNKELNKIIKTGTAKQKKQATLARTLKKFRRK